MSTPADHWSWADVAKLPTRKKLEYIWQYYHWPIIVAILSVIVLLSLLQTIRYNSREQLISGIFVNNHTTEAGYARVSDDYLEFCGGGKDARVELIQGRELHYDLDPLPQEDAATYMVLTNMYSTHSLDYIITDEPTLAYLETENLPLDLRTILTEEQLQRLDIIETPTGAAAIRLGNTQFAADYPLYSDTSVLIVVRNTPDPAKVVRFLQYLLPEMN